MTYFFGGFCGVCLFVYNRRWINTSYFPIEKINIQLLLILNFNDLVKVFKMFDLKKDCDVNNLNYCSIKKIYVYYKLWWFIIIFNILIFQKSCDAFNFYYFPIKKIVFYYYWLKILMIWCMFLKYLIFWFFKRLQCHYFSFNFHCHPIKKRTF